jgi:hypothetical protein
MHHTFTCTHLPQPNARKPNLAPNGFGASSKLVAQHIFGRTDDIILDETPGVIVRADTIFEARREALVGFLQRKCRTHARCESRCGSCSCRTSCDSFCRPCRGRRVQQAESAQHERRSDHSILITSSCIVPTKSKTGAKRRRSSFAGRYGAYPGREVI